MMHKGMRVVRLTKRVGQTAPTGKIVAIRGSSYEIRWDDGHTSITSSEAVLPATATISRLS
jgi:hypothetical protein